MRTCTVANCDNKHSAKGLCLKHYNQQYSYIYTRSDRQATHIRKPEQRFKYCQRQANKRNLVWSVNLSEYKDIIQKPCYYCEDYHDDTGVGLDQIVPRGGYTVDNILRCCGKCNALKNNVMTVTEAKALIMLLKTMRGGKVWSTD